MYRARVAAMKRASNHRIAAMLCGPRSAGVYYVGEKFYAVFYACRPRHDPRAEYKLGRATPSAAPHISIHHT